MTVIWSWVALRELAAIRDYLGPAGDVAVARFRTAIRGAVKDIEDFPRLGRDGRTRGQREKPVGKTNWIIVYRQLGEHIEILHIWDGRRDLPRR